jgi:hypothetical protein
LSTYSELTKTNIAVHNDNEVLYIKMDNFGLLSTLSPEFKKKLGEVRDRAEKAEEHTCNFLEINSNPVTSLYLITGQKKNDGSVEKDIHMSFEQQTNDFPVMPVTEALCDKQGYSWYTTKVKRDYDLGITSKYEPMKFDYWKEVLYNMRHIIDASIKTYHGIKCYEDGDMTNDNIKNVYFLHVCDVMNLYINKKDKKQTTLLLKSKLLEELKHTTIDQLTTCILNEEYTTFFVDNIDFLYTTYCYYGNASMLPIRTHIAEESRVFMHSKFFMNSVHYAKHQRGKLNWVNQTQKGTMNACVYRTY